MNLLDHFKAMQAKAAEYIEPATYTGEHSEGVIQANSDPSDKPRRDALFIADMIYMLDGPEQRAVQADAEKGEAYHSEWRLDIRKQVEQSDQIAKAAKEQVKGLELKVTALTEDNNDLRDRLLTSELAYAKLRGYLDRVVDEQPPVMVPQKREPLHGSMPDGTMGTEYGGWRGGNGGDYAPYGGQSSKRWYHR